MKTNFLKLVIFGLLFVFAVNMKAQQMPPVPIDAKIRYGKLENGLTYYIRANNLPKDRAEFHIAQNVGAILENDDQNGLAHFLEHMAFNGTENFPGKGIINYFETIGVKFGSNINAYTSLDETVYNLSDVPTTRESIIDSALLVLHDWSSFISLLEEEIDAERGVIREEWRTGANSERRMWKESNIIKYPGSQYAKRDVIGDTAVINNFTYKVLRDYYHKWYRPDQQAILIVGDIDVDQVEAKIKALFADVPRAENAGERPIYSIENNVEPIVAVVKDPEARFTRIGLEYKHDKLPTEIKQSIAGYAMGVANNLISTMLGERFQEISQQGDAPFVGGYAYYGDLVKSKDAFQMLVVPHEGRELEGLKALLLEAEKAKRHGFTSSELERAKTNLLNSIEKAYNDRENQRNSQLVREYIQHFLNDELIPGIEWEYETLQVLLPQVQTDMVNKLVQNYVTDENLIVSFTAPEKETVNIPSEALVLEAIVASKEAEIAAKEEEDLNQTLISKIPKAGKIKKTSKNQELGTTEWTLKNGVTVVFKPTKFKEDEILLTAFSPGGLSKVQNINDLPSAVLATSILGSSGLGEFNQTELGKVLTGKTASVRPTIDGYSEGFIGSSSVKDFETLVQLIYLNFTAQRKDENAYKALVNMFSASLTNRATDPRTAFSDTISTWMSNNSERNMIVDMKLLEKVELDRAIAIFNDRFAIPADFTFVFTGNINPDDAKTKELILTYLGGLKSKKTKEKFSDNNIRMPKGIVQKRFVKDMKINKASNFILYSATMPYNMTNRTNMSVIGSILSMRYLESIREKEGGSYGVGVRGSITNEPIDQATLLMQFDTDPEKQTRLMEIIHAEVTEIVKNGPREDDLQKVKENLLKKINEDMAENGWWNSTVVRYYQDDINLVRDYKASVEALTPELIQETLKKLVDQGNVLEVVMMPAE